MHIISQSNPIRVCDPVNERSAENLHQITVGEQEAARKQTLMDDCVIVRALSVSVVS